MVYRESNSSQTGLKSQECCLDEKEKFEVKYYRLSVFISGLFIEQNIKPTVSNWSKLN